MRSALPSLFDLLGCSESEVASLLDTTSAHTRKLPTRSEALLFSAKVWGLRAERWARNLQSDVRQWPQGLTSSANWFRGYESRTALWLEQDTREQRLERGKVVNLRVACGRMDGAIVEVGGVFSFWRQIGRAGKRQGFVTGRMLQQGCLIPAVGGGLCQLSNALYELALLSGCEIVERHAHSARLPHMPLHDATVAWNYIDLRFRVRERMRLRASLTANELVVGFEGTRPAVFGVLSACDPSCSSSRLEPVRDKEVASCASCGETACFRHRDFVE